MGQSTHRGLQMVPRGVSTDGVEITKRNDVPALQRKRMKVDMLSGLTWAPGKRWTIYLFSLAEIHQHFLDDVLGTAVNVGHFTDRVVFGDR